MADGQLSGGPRTPPRCTSRERTGQRSRGCLLAPGDARVCSQAAAPPVRFSAEQGCTPLSLELHLETTPQFQRLDVALLPTPKP